MMKPIRWYKLLDPQGREVRIRLDEGTLAVLLREGWQRVATPAVRRTVIEREDLQTKGAV